VITLIKELLFKLFFKYIPVFFQPKKSTEIQTKIGVTMLLCHKDMSLVLYSLQSLFFRLGYSLPVYITDDGSLTADDRHLLNTLFTVTIETEAQVLLKINKKFSNYPMLLKYFSDRKNNIKKIKACWLTDIPTQKNYFC